MEGTANFNLGSRSAAVVDKTNSSSTGEITQTESVVTAKTEEASKTAAPVVAKTARQEKDEELDKPFLEKRSVTIALITNYSYYRKANDKSLPKRRDFIGSSIRSSRTLSSNKEEVEAYFPNIIGVARNNENFTTRVKQYLNNIQIEVNELGKTFDCSFNWKHKKDYFTFKAEEEKIEETYRAVNRQNLQDLKKALEAKITDLNLLESRKYAYGSPVDVEDYIKYRHCLLYREIAKDTALINSDPSLRFYFKDDQKEQELLQRRRLEVNNAKRNYIQAVGDNEIFDAIYTQYCVAVGLPVLDGILKDRIEKEIELDKYSIDEPVKFNKMFNDKDLKIKAFIETLIARGEFVRASDNQNISTPAGEFIGANMKEAVIWYKNPANEKAVLAYKNKLRF